MILLLEPENPPDPPKLAIVHFALPEEFKAYYADAEPPKDDQ